MAAGRDGQDPHDSSSGNGPSPALRPRAEDDDARIVEIYNRQEPDSAPLTVERYREEHAAIGSDGRSEQWVAVEEGRVVGVASFHPAWWTGDPGFFAADIRVDQSRWRQGIGTSLYLLLQSRLLALEATRLRGWVRADAGAARRFAARHGFQETGEVEEEYRLHRPAARAEAYEGGEERLRRDGLRFASLAELGTDDEALLHALHHLWASTSREAPDPERLAESFSSWRREVLDAPGLSPETHWVALDGERPVGMTFLKRLADVAAENDYTGVAPAYRGRGIAPALKLRAIAWAREHGVGWFYTGSVSDNRPMISINTRLGYQPGGRRIEVARDLIDIAVPSPPTPSPACGRGGFIGLPSPARGRG